eukprot:63264-Chlamydomonas_euryale.AAC.1
MPTPPHFATGPLWRHRTAGRGGQHACRGRRTGCGALRAFTPGAPFHPAGPAGGACDSGDEGGAGGCGGAAVWTPAAGCCT